MLQELIVSLMLLGGSSLMLLAGIGVIRFPNALCRSHALAKASTLGICLLLGALWITLNDELSGLKILLVICFSLLTIPLSGHLVARFGYNETERRQPDLGLTETEKGKENSDFNKPSGEY